MVHEKMHGHDWKHHFIYITQQILNKRLSQRQPDLLIFICVLAISQEPLLMNGESENRQYQI